MTRELIRALRNQPYTYHPGWGGPEYTSWQDEQLSWKNTCYIGDWSFLMDIEVSGSDALRLFRETSVNSFEKFEVGQAKHVIQCNQAGKVIAEGVLMRMDEAVFRTQSTPALYSAFLLSKGGYEARWRHLDTFQFQVSGPKARRSACKPQASRCAMLDSCGLNPCRSQEGRSMRWGRPWLAKSGSSCARRKRRAAADCHRPPRR